MHPADDQFFRVEAGDGEIIIDGARHRVTEGFAMVVPAGARHNVRATGNTPLKLYTLYAPPQHRRDVVQRTKADAQRQHEHFDGKTSE
ncbi:Cupin domain protein [compost metagenome]